MMTRPTCKYADLNTLKLTSVIFLSVPALGYFNMEPDFKTQNLHSHTQI